MRLLAHILPLALALLGAAAPVRAGGLELRYLHNLATLTGQVRLNGLGLSYDPAGRELFAIGYGGVRVFNSAGVETYQFGYSDDETGFVTDVAALEDGDLVLLTYRERDFALLRANFRGEIQETLKLTGVPPEFPEDFRPTSLAYARGRIYLADRPGMRVLVVDERGRTLAAHDLAAVLGQEAKRQDLGLSGFAVDQEGNLLFTIASLFKAYLYAPGGEARSFGTPGSAPGKFNVVSGIAADDRGHLFVVDSLKCAVLVFDRDFKFLGEFGYRGHAPGRLIAPSGVAVGQGRVYVAQYGGRGVTVYQVRE
jgi:DNA-binding beta-propeller fold protein YncE